MHRRQNETLQTSRVYISLFSSIFFSLPSPSSLPPSLPPFLPTPDFGVLSHSFAFSVKLPNQPEISFSLHHRCSLHFGEHNLRTGRRHDYTEHSAPSLAERRSLDDASHCCLFRCRVGEIMMEMIALPFPVFWHRPAAIVVASAREGGRGGDGGSRFFNRTASEARRAVAQAEEPAATNPPRNRKNTHTHTQAWPGLSSPCLM